MSKSTALKTLKSIQYQIAQQYGINAAKIGDLEDKAFEVFSELMGNARNKRTIKAMIRKLGLSKELTDYRGDEWAYMFAHVELETLIDVKDKNQKDLLSRYFGENYNLQLDFENDCILEYIGPAIIINDEGNVLDQDGGKWVISKSDYSNEAELYSLIEKYMEKTGCFPSVIRQDRHGNSFFVNTSVQS